MILRLYLFVNLIQGLVKSFGNVTSFKVQKFELFLLLIVFLSKQFHPQSLIYERNISPYSSGYTFLDI